MFNTQLTEDVKKKVQEALNKDPNFMPAFLAKELGVPEGVVISALPDEMRSFANADRFEEIWEAATKWEKATFIVSNSGAIIEYKGKIPTGKFGHGYFNLMEKSHPLGGHLMVSQLGAICFLNKQLFNLESLSIQFFAKDGSQMFSIYVGREKKELIPAVKEAWLEMKENFSTK